MSKPIVFISYSHDSDEHREKVLALSERLRIDGIDARLDRYINGTPAEGWPLWMLNQLDDAHFVLVICTETYYRRYRGKEEPGKGKGVRWEGALITQDIYDDMSRTVKYVPVLFSDNHQQFIPNPIRLASRYSLTSEDNYQSLLDYLLGRAGVEPGTVGEPELKPRAKGQPLTFDSDTTTNPQSTIRNPQSISISRLPQLLTRDLFGRERELQMLDDAWANPRANVIVFVAFGGSGKSALVNRWMQRMAEENYRGAERVYVWSFWSQGSDQAQTSADHFIDAALRWFGDPDPTAGSPWEKGERLAQLIRKTRTLLILDGLEPLQHPRVPMEGRLKEQSMQALLGELAGSQPGLCIVSTREQIADLQGYAEPAVVSQVLDQLSPQAGAQILREQKIAGEADELEQAAREFGCHALALTILGSLLKNAYDGDIRRRKELAPLTEDEQNGGHARRVMTSYEKWLSEAGEDSMLAVLRLLGLFNRPADARSLTALRAAPVIPGLTDGLQHLKEHEWRQTVAKLRRFKLLAESDAGVATEFSLSPAPVQTGGQTKVRPTEELDAHALVREHFGQQMKRDHPDAWRAANLRLYEHLITTPKELPDTVEEMSPLFAAVAHGCEAGRHQQAYENVYRRQIQRGNELFSTKKLGAFGADLAALAGFFETPWRQPVAGLAEHTQAFILNQAGVRLFALGRLPEAAEPLQAALQTHLSREDWKNAATDVINLSELYLTIGDLPHALEFARQSVTLADRSGGEFERMISRTTLASALHQAGQAEDAEAVFPHAEEMQKQRQPIYPILYSLSGFWYCDLLLGQGKHQEVKERAARTLEEGKGWYSLLSIALDNLSLGRAWLLQSRQASAGDDGPAAEFLQRAVDGLRQAGRQDYLPRGLLARAELRRVKGDYPRARRSGRSAAHRRTQSDGLASGRLSPGTGAPLPGAGRERHGAQGLGDGQSDDLRDGLPPAGRGSGGD